MSQCVWLNRCLCCVYWLLLLCSACSLHFVMFIFHYLPLHSLWSLFHIYLLNFSACYAPPTPTQYLSLSSSLQCLRCCFSSHPTVSFSLPSSPVSNIPSFSLHPFSSFLLFSLWITPERSKKHSRVSAWWTRSYRPSRPCCAESS